MEAKSEMSPVNNSRNFPPSGKRPRQKGQRQRKQGEGQEGRERTPLHARQLQPVPPVLPVQ